MKSRWVIVVIACLAALAFALAHPAARGRLGAAFTSPEIAQRAESGRARFNGHVLEDDNGPFLGLGASLFWGVWGYDHDRARLIQHFDALRPRGFDFVRVLGAVAGPSWNDRAADPRQAGYDSTIAGLTDLAFQHGLRIAWSIFGDTVAAQDASMRLALVDRFARMTKGREHKILFIEIANEGWQNGFGARLSELQELARRLKSQTPVLVSVTAPQPPLRCGAAVTSIYAPGAADFITLHFDRNIGAADGRWGPVRQPLMWPSLFVSCRDNLPVAAANWEPIGPQSSVASEEDPLHLVTAAVVTYTAGLPIYVLHTGPGVRGGGRADRALRRAASLTELPRAEELLRAFATMKQYLPRDLAGWSRFDATRPDAPVQIQMRKGGLKPVDIAAARRGNQFVVVPFGIRDRLDLPVSLPVGIEVIHPVTGARLVQRTLASSGRVELPAEPAALVIIGRAP